MSLAAIDAIILLAVSIARIYLSRKHKYLLTGWLWYLGTLVPVIGLVQVGFQAYADRYTYIPLIGLFIIIAWGADGLLAKFRYRKTALAASAISVLLALSITAHFQQRHWQNTITLCRHALEVTEGNYMAHYCISTPLREQGKIIQAIDHCSECLRLKPDFIRAHNGMGTALLELGRIDEAIEYFNNAINLKHDCYQAYSNLGIALARQKRFP